MFPAAPEPESSSLASSSLASGSLASSGKPKGDEVVIDELDALPEEPAVMGPALGLGDSGAPKGT